MKVDFEYGQGTVSYDFKESDDVDVFIPGVTVKDPPFIEEGLLEKETLKSIQNPIGMPTISNLVKKGSKVVIVFPDRVKGGEQKTSHRKISIKLVLNELYKCGVEKKDITLICSNGLHRKNTKEEILNILGPELFNEFYFRNQIENHDSEDWDNLVDLGKTEAGDPVIMNKKVFESDLAILIGHVQGNPYGGYSGGYKHAATGITHWRSIASHHNPNVMHRPDFTPVSGKSLMRDKFNQIGQHMEEKMGKKFFCIDAVLDSKSRQISIYSGYAKEMMSRSWIDADKRTYVPFARKKYDIMIFGLPQSFHYGDGMGTNPIMLSQAISAQVVRHKRVLKDNCVIIALSTCNGFMNETLWPYIPKLLEEYDGYQMNTLLDMERLGEYYATDESFVRDYRFKNAFHPFHGFSMMSSVHIAEMNTSAVYIVGAEKPGEARRMGWKTRKTIEEALLDAKEKYVGENPHILALPLTFKTASVHLCMKE